MTSEERREGRYQRRKAKREAKRLQILEAHSFEKVIDLDSLYKAMTESRREVYWKTSVQRYNINYLRKILKTHSDLENLSDIRKGFIEFIIRERGKIRNISSVHFSERVVQKSICRNALVPHLTRTLIHDNGASMKDKGIHFAMNRLKKHLRQHYKEHGTEGYALLIDFSNYFGNILHKPLYDIYNAAFGEDEKLVWLASLFVSAFGDNSLGLGSETSQISAVAYMNKIDHFMKEVMRCKYYSHYMDDLYIICPTKEEAERMRDTLMPMFEEIGIVVKPSKIAIVKLTKGITHLKMKFYLTETGRVVVRPNRSSIVRQRRKLKKFKRFYDAGTMSLEDIESSYMSWRGYISHCNSWRSVNRMDLLYESLFGYHPMQRFRRN